MDPNNKRKRIKYVSELKRFCNHSNDFVKSVLPSGIDRPTIARLTCYRTLDVWRPNAERDATNYFPCQMKISLRRLWPLSLVPIHSDALQSLESRIVIFNVLFLILFVHKLPEIENDTHSKTFISNLLNFIDLTPSLAGLLLLGDQPRWDIFQRMRIRESQRWLWSFKWMCLFQFSLQKFLIDLFLISVSIQIQVERVFKWEKHFISLVRSREIVFKNRFFNV